MLTAEIARLTGRERRRVARIELTAVMAAHGSDAVSVGVEMQRPAERTRASGRRPARRSTSSSTATAAAPAGRWPASATAISAASCRTREPATATGCGSTARCCRPDPASRYPAGWAARAVAIVDPAAFRWTDGGWRGVSADGQVVYELHVGTFTPRGDLARGGRRARRARRSRHHDRRDDADRRLRRPLRLGLRRRQSLRADAPLRHARRSARRSSIARTRSGIGVILDVVYNHLGPDGNYLSDFSARLLHRAATRTTGARRSTSKTSPPARAFFVENAGYWIDEFHFDGLRLDATQDIHDASPDHVVAELIRQARAAAGSRAIYVVAENEPQDTHAGPRSGGAAATASTRSGTTTFITPRSSR